MLKSYATQLGLTLIFGPLGLMYSSVAIAVFLTLILAVMYFTEIGPLSVLLAWPVAMVTGLALVRAHNEKMRQSSRWLLLGPGEEGDRISTAGAWGRGFAVALIMAAVGAAMYFQVSPKGGPGRIVEAPAGTNSLVGRVSDGSNPAAEIAVNPDSSGLVSNENELEPVGTSSDLRDSFSESQANQIVVGTTASKPAVDPASLLFINAEVVNLRSGPSTNNSIVEQLDRDAELQELQRQGPWIQVTVRESSNVGWIFGELVR